MRLKFYILLGSVIFFFACGTKRKVAERKEKEVSTIESNNSVTITEVDFSADRYLNSKLFKWVFTPVDDSKPIIIDGIEYKNVKIEKEFETSNDSVFEKSPARALNYYDHEFQLEQKETAKTTEKEKQSGSSFFAWGFFVVGLIVLVIGVYKFKKYLWL